MTYRGGISLFLAIVMFALSSYFVLLVPMFTAKRLEPIAEAALLRQSEVILASYQRDLMERYGIPGILEDTPDLEISAWLTEYLDPQEFSQSILWTKSFADTEAFREIILNYMKLRMPKIVIQEIYTQMKELTPNGQRELIPISGVYAANVIPLSVDPITGFLNYMEQRSTEQAVLEELLDPQGAVATSYDEELEDFQAEMEKLRRDKDEAEASVHGLESSVIGLPALEQLSSVNAYLKKIAQRLFKPFYMAYETLTLREFLITHLSCEIRHNGRIVPDSNPFTSDLSPRLWDFSTQTFSSEHELEVVATGVKSPKLAFHLVQAEIFGLRFLLNCVAFYHDSARMTSYHLGNFWQQLVAAILTFFGIDPAVTNEVVVCLRLLIDAAKQAVADVRSLCQGNTVPFFHGPLGKHGVELDYLHYLRFLLLFSSDEVLLERFLPILEENVGAENHQIAFELQLDIASRFHHKTYQREADYLAWELSP